VPVLVVSSRRISVTTTSGSVTGTQWPERGAEQHLGGLVGGVDQHQARDPPGIRGSGGPYDRPAGAVADQHKRTWSAVIEDAAEISGHPAQRP
jgi:hypothetical protein